MYGVMLKRNDRVAYVKFINQKGEVHGRKIFMSTNLKRDAKTIVRFYKASYQMEFIFELPNNTTELNYF